MNKAKRNRRMAIPALIAAGALSLTAFTGVALAQETDTTDTDVTTEAPVDRAGNLLEDLVSEGQITQEQADAIAERLATRGGPGFGRHGGGVHLGTDVAELLGLDATELHEALEGGATIADLAAEQGLSVDDVVAAATADAFARVDEQLASGAIDADRAAELKAQITERVTAHVNGEIPLRGAFGGRSFGIGVDVAELLGMDAEELRAAIEDGSTIADLAVEQGLIVDDVIETLTADAYERIDEKVAEGTIDADQAEEMKSHVTERVTDMVNGDAPLGRGGPGRGPGGHGGPGRGPGGPGGGPGNGPATGQGAFLGGGTSA